ncbi:MAG TPA: hypothetical protein VHS33_11275 [Sphingomicrobium sp.]|jgi:hypothetical protein|nr:hypothetical protein [Sphingomicrobium sp.]
MHVHLPKPLHGWRAFAGEVGIIVLGVLIALSAEQVVEYFRNLSELRKAENAMKSELRDDDLPQAFIRAAVYPCYSAQLDAIEDAVASADRAKFVTLSKAYNPVFRTWDDAAWRAALASQILAYAGSKRMIDWAGAYIPIPILSHTASQESDALSRLWTRLDGDGPIPADQRQRLFQVISDLRLFNRGMNFSSLAFMNVLSKRGLTLDAHRKRELLLEARQTYGGCAAEPSPERLNMKRQLTFVFSDPLSR